MTPIGRRSKLETFPYQRPILDHAAGRDRPRYAFGSASRRRRQSASGFGHVHTTPLPPSVLSSFQLALFQSWRQRLCSVHISSGVPLETRSYPGQGLTIVTFRIDIATRSDSELHHPTRHPPASKTEAISSARARVARDLCTTRRASRMVSATFAVQLIGACRQPELQSFAATE
jgi:hypothetical protein